MSHNSFSNLLYKYDGKYFNICIIKMPMKLNNTNPDRNFWDLITTQNKNQLSNCHILNLNVFEKLLRNICVTYVRLIYEILPMLPNRYVTYSVAYFFVENQSKANGKGGEIDLG